MTLGNHERHVNMEPQRHATFMQPLIFITITTALLMPASHAATGSLGVKIEDGDPMDLIGIQEGGLRTLTCAHGGMFTGVQAHFNITWGYEELYITGLSLLCTSKTLMVNEGVTLPDTHTFGHSGIETQTASCPSDTGIRTIKYRYANIVEGNQGARRVAAIQLECGASGKPMAPVRVDVSAKLPAAIKLEVKCSSIDEDSVMSKFRVWWSGESFSGLEPMSCSNDE